MVREEDRVSWNDPVQITDPLSNTFQGEIPGCSGVEILETGWREH